MNKYLRFCFFFQPFFQHSAYEKKLKLVIIIALTLVKHRSVIFTFHLGDI